MKRLASPLTTAGCAVNSAVQFTNPFTCAAAAVVSTRQCAVDFALVSTSAGPGMQRERASPRTRRTYFEDLTLLLHARFVVPCEHAIGVERWRSPLQSSGHGLARRQCHI